MKAYVDGSPTRICYIVAYGDNNYSLPVVRDLGAKYTSNQAEYFAVLFTLYELPGVDEIFSDSELVVKQLNGEDVIRNKQLQKIAWEICLRAGGRSRGSAL